MPWSLQSTGAVFHNNSHKACQSFDWGLLYTYFRCPQVMPCWCPQVMPCWCLPGEFLRGFSCLYQKYSLGGSWLLGQCFKVQTLTHLGLAAVAAAAAAVDGLVQVTIYLESHHSLLHETWVLHCNFAIMSLEIVWNTWSMLEQLCSCQVRP